MNANELRTIILNEPLFERSICLQSMSETQLPQTKTNLFVGVGLCTATQPAVGIPFDIISFFLLPELLRRKGLIESTFFLIADTHALTNSFMTPSLVTTLTQTMKQTALSIIRSFRLQNMHVVVASEIRNESSFKTVLEELPKMENAYVREEIADVAWFMQMKNVRFKLGWTISNEIIPSGHDERFFDMEMKQFLSTPLIFLHTEAGRTFDPKHPKASPYITIRDEKRTLLTPTTGIENLKSNTTNDEAVMNHIKRIVRLFETCIVKIPFSSLEEKLNFIIQTATQDVPAVV